jgi:putative membrane protein
VSTDLSGLVAHAGCAGWGPGPWLLVFPLFWLLLIGFLVFAFARRRAWGPPAWSGRPYAAPDPMSVLAERYARGDIDEAEYRRRLDVLRGTPPS